MTHSQEVWIKDNFYDMSVERLRKEFNAMFGTDYKTTAFHYHTKRLGLSKHIQHKYTAEEDAFLQQHSSNMTRAELTELFNKTFGTQIKEQAIVQRCFLKGYEAQTDGKFKAGSVPWEKTKGGREEYVKKLKGGNSHSFPKGIIPHNRKEIGEVSKRKDGIYIKTKDGWKSKQRLVYESYYGEIPDKTVIVFVDRDKNNYSIENLRAIDNRTLTYLMSNDWLKEELIDVGISYAKLKILLEETGTNG